MVAAFVHLAQVEPRRYVADAFQERNHHSLFSKVQRRSQRPSCQSSLQTIFEFETNFAWTERTIFVVPTEKRRRCAGELCKRRPFSACEECDVGLWVFYLKDYHSS